MTPNPLDKPSGADHDDHETRIARLEVTVDNLAQANATLRSDMNDGFKSLRDLIVQSTAALQHSIERLDDKHESLAKEVRDVERNLRKDMTLLDQNMHRELFNQHRWVIGLLISNLLAILALVAKTMALI